MIQSITLRNWQCWKFLHLDLDRITILVGDNDVGKSAILRAIEWVCLNNWEGEANDHVTWGAEYSEVIMVVDGNRIARRKGEKINEYQLGTEVFRAFGAGVPSPISQILRLSNRNLQGQHDPAYWLMLTPGQAAGELNDIFNLSAIDVTMFNAGKAIRELGRGLEVCRIKLNDTRKRKEEIDRINIKELNKKLKRLERLDKEIRGKKRRIEKLEDLQREVKRVDKFGQIYHQKITALTAVLNVANQIVSQKETISRLEEAKELLEEAEETEKKYNKAKTKYLKAMEGACPTCQTKVGEVRKPPS